MFIIYYSGSTQKQDQVQEPELVRVRQNAPLAVLSPPMVLMIQTELCEERTLKNWLLENIDAREKKIVVGFFDQVSAVTYVSSWKIWWGIKLGTF